MTFKERIQALKDKAKALIKPESTPEEIEAVNGLIAEYDALDTEHDGSLTENAKFKDTIVRLVATQGNDDTPKDDSDVSKTMSIEEAIAQVEKGGK